MITKQTELCYVTFTCGHIDRTACSRAIRAESVKENGMIRIYRFILNQHVLAPYDPDMAMWAMFS